MLGFVGREHIDELTLVTRNTAHFHFIVKALLNPWT